jgi:hypothetical protein
MDDTKNSSVIDTLEKLDLKPVKEIFNTGWESGQQYSLSSNGIDTIEPITINSTMDSSSLSNNWLIGANVGSITSPIWTTSISGTSVLNDTAVNVKQSGLFSIQGENADISINGKSLMKTLEALEERLNWLQPNTKLEDDWNELKELGDRYRELEQRCKDKATVWEKLKAMPPPEID